METVGDTVFIISELTVQNNLEERLHYRWHGAVKLIQHDNTRTFTGGLKPGRNHEGCYLLFIDCAHIG